MKIQNIKSFWSAVTPSDLAGLVKAAGGTLGPKLSALTNTQDRLKVTRIILAVFAAIGIGVSGYLSIQGAKFIFDSGFLISVIFSILSLVLLALLMLNIFKGKAVYILLALEIIGFCWASVMMPGYFGRDNAKNAAEKQVSRMYTIARNTYYNDAISLNDLTKLAAKMGTNIAKIEKERDTKGPVYEKGLVVGTLATDSIGEFPVLIADSLVPTFTSMPEANRWVETQTAELNSKMQGYQSISNALIQQAQGIAKGVDSAIAPNMSAMQISNLHSLSEAVRQIGNYKISAPELKSRELTTADLQVDFVHKAIGFLIGLVIVAMMFIIIRLQASEVSMDDLHKEAANRGISKLLADWSISHKEIEKLDYQSVENLAGILEEDQPMRDWVKNNGGFNTAFALYEKYPNSLNLLKAGGVTIARMEKMLTNYPELEEHLPKILAVPETQWNMLISAVTITRALELVNDAKLFVKVVEIIDAAKKRFTVRVEDMRKYLDKVLIAEANEGYLDALLILTKKMSEPGLKAITPEFISVLDTGAADFIATHTKPGENFSLLVKEWGTEDTARSKKFLSNGITSDANFPSFMKAVFDMPGLKGFHAASNAYEECARITEFDNAGSEVTLNPTVITKLRDAFGKRDENGIMDGISGVFEAKPKSS